MTLSTILLIIAAVLIGFGALLGTFRGISRAFLRLFTVFVAFFGVAIGCRFFLRNTEAVLENKTLGALLDKLGINWLDALKEALPELYDTLIAFPVAILAPILYTVLFFLACGLLQIVYGIIAAFVFPKKEHTPILSRVLGAVFGAVQGAVVTVALAVPLVGLLGTAVDVIDTVSAEKGEYTTPLIQVAEEYRDQLAELEDSPVLKCAARLGGQQICDSIMTFAIADSADPSTVHIVDLRKESVVFSRIFAHALPLINVKPAAYTETQSDAISRIVDDLKKSDVAPELVAGLLSSLSTSWSEGESFFGIAPPDTEGQDYAEAFEELYLAFSASTADTVGQDLDTVAALIDVMTRHGIFSCMDDPELLEQRMTDPAVLDDLYDTLSENPRTKQVARKFVLLAMGNLCLDHLALPELGTPEHEKYTAMAGEIADALNSFGSREELESGINEAIKDYGVSDSIYSEYVIEILADTMLDELEDSLGSVTPQQITDFIAGR